MKRSIFLFVLAIGLAVASLQTAAEQTDKSNDAHIAAARKAIDAGNVEWIAGQKAGDADKMASLFDRDGSQFGAKGRVIRGRKAIHDRFAKLQGQWPGAGLYDRDPGSLARRRSCVRIRKLYPQV